MCTLTIQFLRWSGPWTLAGSTAMGYRIINPINVIPVQSRAEQPGPGPDDDEMVLSAWWVVVVVVVIVSAAHTVNRWTKLKKRTTSLHSAIFIKGANLPMKPINLGPAHTRAYSHYVILHSCHA